MSAQPQLTKETFWRISRTPSCFLELAFFKNDEPDIIFFASQPWSKRLLSNIRRRDGIKTSAYKVLEAEIIQTLSFENGIGKDRWFSKLKGWNNVRIYSVHCLCHMKWSIWMVLKCTDGKQPTTWDFFYNEKKPPIKKFNSEEKCIYSNTAWQNF